MIHFLYFDLAQKCVPFFLFSLRLAIVICNVVHIKLDIRPQNLNFIKVLVTPSTPSQTHAQ